MGYFLSKEHSFKNTAIHFYQQALGDEKREIRFLDSLYKTQLISKDNYNYRKDILGGLIEHHKNNKIIEKWLVQNKLKSDAEQFETIYDLDLSKTDSLMGFSYFRTHLNTISKYNLGLIKVNHTNSGGSYIDSKSRFDSILKDKRFNQTARNYLLFEAYRGIGMNFKVKDKERYFKKLVEHTTNRKQLNEFQEKYNLDFSKSDQLILTSLKNDTITFSNLLKKNKGKWLYIDFWASWCKPCRKTMPESVKLKKELENDNIAFIYLSLNDRKKAWQLAIESDGLQGSENYFIENGNSSKVIENLGIKTIPHYLIYNPNGDLVNGYANRPGKGAKQQLKELMSKK
jgi:thiol-disulfide isomerase/thioredoxin